MQFRTKWQFPLPPFLCALVLAAAMHSADASEAAAAEELPHVGDVAADFELKGIDGKPVKLSGLTKEGPVVLIVLRGYPGYQCPLCTRQVGQFIAASGKFRKAGATVVLIYPGPAEGLQKHAREFLPDEMLPAGFHLLTDPDFRFTQTWNLRWNAPRETAYPSTFVIDTGRRIRFAKISMTHGDRTTPDQVLKALR